MNFFRPIKPLLKGWLLSFAGFGFVAFVISVQFLATERLGVAVAIKSSLRDFLPWAILTPLLFRLVARYPLGRREWLPHAALQLMGGLAVLSICHWWTGVMDPGFRAGTGGPMTHQSRLPGPPPFHHDGPRGGPPDGERPPPPDEEWPREMGPPPRDEAPRDSPAHFVDLVHIGTFQLPLFFMIMSAAHASLFYRRDREREANLAKAQLIVLTTQLQPHFLFNTLNMIAELVHEDANKADAMITALSEMLRLALDANATELVPLQKEAQFVERYFAIMQTRFGERLQYDCDISAAARTGLVPPFLLQPLVENAIRHGLEPKRNGGTVTIRGEVEGNILRVSVRDDGVGLPPGESKREGVGLTNTRERLRQLFGERASITVTENEGVTVEVALPFTAL